MHHHIPSPLNASSCYLMENKNDQNTEKKGGFGDPVMSTTQNLEIIENKENPLFYEESHYKSPTSNDSDGKNLQNATYSSISGTDVEDGPGYHEITINVTESQFQAISKPLKMDQMLRIRAGPGSGKTFTLVARIAQILADGTRPDEILVLSMANRSVESLKSTLSKLVGAEKAAAVEISTFHSFCAGLLEQHGSLVNSAYTKQNILDDTTWKTMVAFFSGKSVKFGPHSIEGSITPVRLGKVMSNIMLGAVSVDQAAAEHKINANYLSSLMQHLKSSGLVRYDELIADATRLIRYSARCLREHPQKDAQKDAPKDAQKDAQKDVFIPRLANYKAVFVDEFQDVYPSLSHVIRCIVEYPTAGTEAPRKHLTITGDPSQSIYEFLGANEKDMLRVDAKFPKMDIVDLELVDSFRCTQPILDAAVKVCLKDDNLELLAVRTDAYPQKPVLLQSRSVVEEYHRVADEIVRLLCLSGGNVHLDDIAILTKTNEAAIAMQSVLKTRYGLPSFKLSSGNQWVNSRLHILKHALGVIAGDSGSSVSLMAVLLKLDTETGSRKRVSRIFSDSINKATAGDPIFLETYLFEELLHISGKKSALATLYKKYPGVLEKLAAFLNQVQAERQILADTHAKCPLEYDPVALVSCLQRMARLEGIAQFLSQESNETSKATPLEILESFNESIHHAFSKYCARAELHSSMTFLDFFLQTYDSEVSAPIGNSIKVSTIHSAKGLEFPIVFVLGQTMYTASWDKVLQDEGAKADAAGESNVVCELSEIQKDGQLQKDGQFQKNGQIQEHIQIQEDNQVEKGAQIQKEKTTVQPQSALAFGSVSRSLYVALTRARNLAYVGCRLPYKELSTTSKMLFASQLPELKSTSSIVNDNGKADTPNSRAPHENHSSFAAQQTNEFSSFQETRNKVAGSLLESVSRDLGRPFPAQRKLEAGHILYENTIRKSRMGSPAKYQKRRFCVNAVKSKPTLRAVSKPSYIWSSAIRNLRVVESALLRRAP